MKANVQLNNEQKVRESVQSLKNELQESSQKQKADFGVALEDLMNYSPNMGGFETIGALMDLPEESFALLAPIFLDELERSMGDTNEKLKMIETFTANKLNRQELPTEFKLLCENIDNSLDSELSPAKKDFFKQLLGMVYTAADSIEGASDHNVFIPIEYCREDAKMPTYAHLTDAGMDVYLTEDVTIHPGETKLIPTGIKVAIPLGYELQVRPKSGRSLKSKLRIANTPGTIDAGYRDEICIIADNIDPIIRHADMDETGRLYNILWGSDITLSKGEKIAQLVLSEVPKAVFYEVESVSTIENDGRKGGFGSSSVYGKDDPRYGSDLV